LYLRKFEGAAVYGVYTNFYAWASMLNNVLAFGMETTYFRYLEKVDAADRPKVYNNSFVVTLITSVLLLSLAFTFTPAIAAWFSQDVAAAEYNIFVQLFALILVADALAVVPFARLRAKGRPMRYSALKFVNIFVTIGSNLFFFCIPTCLGIFKCILGRYSQWVVCRRLDWLCVYLKPIG